MSRTHLKSVRLYLSPLFVFSTVHANSKCCRLLWVENILFSPISPFHTAFQLERISISPKHCHMSPLLSSPSFLKYRFKRSITDIHSYSLPIEASIYCIYTVNIYIYIHIYNFTFNVCEAKCRGADVSITLSYSEGLRFEFPARANQILDVRFKVPVAVSTVNSIL